MLNKRNYTGIAVILTILGVFLLAACSPGANEAATVAETAVKTEPVTSETKPVVETASNNAVSSNEVTTADEAPTATVAEAAAPANSNIAQTNTAVTLSDEEIAGLVFMREEEKLARDVYLTLYDQWGAQVFQNISSSEQTHMDAVLAVLNQYNLTDPAAGNEIGQFTDAALQDLYDQLIAEGSQSLEDALRVGAAIEEIDILDLEQRMAQTDNADITQLYQQLENGSENHLQAFVSNIERQTGTTYQPQYMSQEAYDLIMNGSKGNGNSSGGQGNNGGGNGQGQNGNHGGKGNGGNGRNNNS